MKRIIPLIIVAAFILSSCQKTNTADLESSEPIETEAEENENTEEPAKKFDVAEYEVVREDYSVYGKDDKPLISLYYDAVQITDDIPNKDAVNKAIADACEKVFEDNGGIEALQANIEDPNFDARYMYYCTVTSHVNNNSDGVFSVVLMTDWYMGGVSDYGYDCLTFDLHTGKQLKLTELFDMSEDDLLELLKETTVEFMDNHTAGGWYYDVVDKYSLEDFTWGICDGELIIYFSKYDIAPGATGGAEVDTGMYIDRD